MAGYEEQAEVIRKFGSERLSKRKKDVAKSGNMETSDEEFSVDEGLADAMNTLEAGEDTNGVYSSDFTLVKNFVRLVDSTGRTTKEGSVMADIVRNVNQFNEAAFFKGKGFSEFEDDIIVFDRLIKAIRNDCQRYIDSSNPWTSSGKQRKALVRALRIQLKNTYDEVYSKNESLMVSMAKRFKRNKPDASAADFLIHAYQYTSANFNDDILNMDAEDTEALKDSLVNEYGLSEEDADNLIKHRGDISQNSAFFGGTGEVTTDMIRKLASQYNAKKDLVGGQDAGTVNRIHTGDNQKAVREAKEYCRTKFGIDTSEALNGNTIVRVLTSMMDLSGTEEAKLKNATIYKDFCLTHKNSDGGYYWKIITDYMNPDLSLFDNREPRFIISNYNKIHDACQVGAEMLQNVIVNMKDETGVEPDEETMTNIRALAQFHSDYTTYAFGIYNMYTQEGSLYTDEDAYGGFDRLLEDVIGPERNEQGLTGTSKQGIDTRVQDYKEKTGMEDMTELGGDSMTGKTSIIDGFAQAMEYKLARSKQSARDILKSMYGWNENFKVPVRKKKVEEIKKES